MTSLPHREWTAFRPRRSVGLVDDVVVDEGRGVNELDHGGVEHRAIARVAAQAGGHQEDGGTDPLAAARADVLADRGDQLDVRLHVPRELSIDVLEIGADWLENLRERDGGLFHDVSWSDANILPATAVKCQRRALG